MKRLLTILLLSLALQGCYTQLSMFHPEVETDTEEFHSYSVARVRPNLSLYANDGAGQSLGMAYGTMYNRFYGFNNRYSYYNPYYYGGIYNDYVNYNIFDGTYTVWIPGIQEKKKKQRIWTRDNKSTTSKLKVTRTRTNTSNRVSDPYPVQDTPKQDTFNSQRSTSSSNSGTRATRRN
jgi:hypothetical protein